MPKIKVTLSIGVSNANQEDILEIDEAEWNKCETEDQRDSLMNQYWKDWSDNYIEGSTELVY
jgi:hypothetical protein